ncbi:acyltransferase [Rhizobium sp. Root482]|uniref:acyltransferase n=1 Tax=Rhizobium sp. Root482 TaxID=1736543 RepID=UPI0009EBBC9A|nr:acyltransferase [Rhizobium sp. Root482]
MLFHSIRAFIVRLKSCGAVKFDGRCRISPGAIFEAGKGGCVRIGHNCDVRHGAMILGFGGRVRLGRNVSLNPYSIIYGHGGVNIGDDVRIAAHVVIVAFNHRFADRDKPIKKQGNTKKGIEIGNDVWIGAGAKILDGTRIADGCVIGANAVLSGQTVPFGIYAGAPAKLIKLRGAPG